MVLNGNFVFNLRDVFQERNPGIKQELRVQAVSFYARVMFLKNIAQIEHEIPF
jgi:ribonuclease HIII